MSQELDRLIQKAIESDQRIFEEIQTKGFTKEQYIQAITDKTKKQVYKEVKEEVRDEAIKEAEKKINMITTNKQMKEIKKLSFTGILLAFFVGLLVNQFTEVITLLKNNGFLSTRWVIVVLAILCMLILIYGIWQELYALWKGTLNK